MSRKRNNMLKDKIFLSYYHHNKYLLKEHLKCRLVRLKMKDVIVQYFKYVQDIISIFSSVQIVISLLFLVVTT